MAEPGLAETVAPVHADVVTSHDLPGLLPDDEHRLGSDLEGRVVARFGQVALEGREEPAARPHPVPLSLHELRTRVAALGNRVVAVLRPFWLDTVVAASGAPQVSVTSIVAR